MTTLIQQVLVERARWLRRETFELSLANGGYHFGGCFSPIEIIVALFYNVLSAQDKFILSKGHACWPLYAILRERGFNPKLEGHPSRDPANGIDCTTGSEGHGLPMGLGMALARKLTDAPGQIYVLMGDGECQEGTTWEALLTAAHRKLNNVTAIVDNNGIQGSGFVNDILPIVALARTAEAAGWCVSSINGHDFGEIIPALTLRCAPRPHLIVARTVKGKGVSYMENKPEWHAKFPDAAQQAKARKELA